MREPRINPVDRDTWHHCYNHATCTAEEFPFGEVEREKFADILKRSTTLFSIDLALFSVMSNHFLCGAPHKKCYVKSGIM
jgi:hypothetical protein